MQKYFIMHKIVPHTPISGKTHLIGTQILKNKLLTCKLNLKLLYRSFQCNAPGTFDQNEYI